MSNDNSLVFLAVTIDSELNFDQHIATLCSTAFQKVKALFRIRSFFNINCAKRLMDSYILSTFCYCPLIWMFCRKHSNNMIDKVNNRALRAVYRLFDTSFLDILTVDQSTSIHIRNLR